MPVVKFDVSGTDPEKAKEFEQPKPGVYRAKVHEINMGYSKDAKTSKPDKTRPRMEVIFEIQDKAYKGTRLWDYVSFSEAAEWKLDQFLQAFGVATAKKRTGSFKTETIVGELCKVRVKADKDQEGNYRAKVAAILPLGEAEDDEDEDFDDEEEEETEDDTEEEDEDEEDEDEESDDEEADDEEEARYYDLAELKGMELATLKDVASDLGLEPPAASTKAKSKLSQWIFDNQPAEAPEEEDEEEEEEESEEEDEDDGYDELSLSELKEEVKERGLKAVGSKDALIAKLRKADADGPF